MSNRLARISAREARARVQEEEQAANGQQEEEEEEEEEEQQRRKRARKDTREWCVFPIGEAARDKHFSRLKDQIQAKIDNMSHRTPEASGYVILNSGKIIAAHSIWGGTAGSSIPEDVRLCIR